MASYHLSAQIIGRSDGRSAVAAAAYRAGVDLTDPDTGTRHDYRRKGGVVAAFIETPADAPPWASRRASLWDAVHAKEARKNSQLAREVRVALPNELEPAQRVELVRAWVRETFTAAGMAADVSVHDPDPDGPEDERNPHAHILLTLREFDQAAPDGWAKGKAREWNSPDALTAWRASWAAAQNAALERVGSEARVDHRSLAAQREDAVAAGDDLLAAALDRPPEPRMGLASAVVEKRARRAGGTEPITPQGIALRDTRRDRAALAAAFRAATRAAAAVRDLGRLIARPSAERSERLDRMRERFGLNQAAAAPDAAPDSAPEPPEADSSPSPAI